MSKKMEQDIAKIFKMLGGIKDCIESITDDYAEDYINTNQVIELLGLNKYKSGYQMFMNLCSHKDEAKRFPAPAFKSKPNWWKRKVVMQYKKEKFNQK